MKIKFKQNFKSISNFDETNIKGFSVLLGVNGSGKTHLLKAIQEGSVSVNNISTERISYFNLQTFLIKNQKSIAPRNLDDDKLQAWNILTEENFKRNIENVESQIKSLIGEVDFPYNTDVPEEKKAQYEQFKKKILQQINAQTIDRPKIRKLLKTGIFEAIKYVTDSKQAEFFKYSNYNPDDYELLESLSEVFLDYQKKLAVAKLSKNDGGEGLSKKEIREMRDQSPWSFVNSMFREFGLLHKISFPVFNAGDLIYSQAVSFQVKLSIDGEEIDFDDLSSGEKILCALAITVYQDSKSSFPDLLLLDEVDASLHPSMVQNLLDVINNVFMKNSCRVILATHSPTTAALTSEESLFEIQKGKELQKIKKISQANAVNLLSEGIVTFEKGLEIQESIDSTKKLQIITEGHNTEHIKKAIEILDNSLLSQIVIIKGSPNKRGQQLKNAYDVMSSGKFSEKFLFVWDCDFAAKFGNIRETGSFKKFCFEMNMENTKAKDKEENPVGIENLYPDSLFTSEVYSRREISGSYGTTTLIDEFDKQKFLEKIKEAKESKVFQNFNPLLEKIRELLSI